MNNSYPTYVSMGLLGPPCRDGCGCDRYTEPFPAAGEMWCRCLECGCDSTADEVLPFGADPGARARAFAQAIEDEDGAAATADWVEVMVA